MFYLNSLQYSIAEIGEKIESKVEWDNKKYSIGYWKIYWRKYYISWKIIIWDFEQKKVCYIHQVLNKILKVSRTVFIKILFKIL